MQADSAQQQGLYRPEYLRAVERYCSHAYLRRFSFSTVAYRAMQQSIVSWKRGESRRRQAEEAYCALYGRRASNLHLICISIKYSLVMSLMILIEDLVIFRVYFKAVCACSLLSHFDTAIRHECSL